ncbi:MAG: hypothetical protein UV05_C0030G0002 [candidate division CPR1 bacterium GW2011_GWA2_42_17]|uniref:Uncharacterized protein n=1 Tax=candidate division CPR1 bacterium GW2011_GWA2_42_17 TaxID=1618341 RepID=A0A0G1BB35_9BACT|nr:MAG: hypothetical protein UV05_C0030G0002 [candidate division CPR1 bacterium GW2011_GWA2_42_17]
MARLAYVLWFYTLICCFSTFTIVLFIQLTGCHREDSTQQQRHHHGLVVFDDEIPTEVTFEYVDEKWAQYLNTRANYQASIAFCWPPSALPNDCSFSIDEESYSIWMSWQQRKDWKEFNRRTQKNISAHILYDGRREPKRGDEITINLTVGGVTKQKNLIVY